MAMESCLPDINAFYRVKRANEKESANENLFLKLQERVAHKVLLFPFHIDYKHETNGLMFVLFFLCSDP